MKNVNYTKIMALATLALPGMIMAGECLTPTGATNISDSDESGYATHVQSDQGQGSIDCSNFIGDEGAMRSIQVAQDPLKATVDSPLLWSVPDEVDGHVDVVFIGNSDGSRCTQFYSGNARSGFAGAGTKTNKNATIVACTDALTQPEPPKVPEPPIAPAITEDGCDDALQYAIDGNPNYDWVIAGGRNENSGADGNTAICVDQSNKSSNGIGGMTRCVERCVTPSTESDVPWYSPDSEQYAPNCSGDGPLFPIECRACALSTEVESDYFDPETQFCWELSHKAKLDESGLSGTFKLPPPDQGVQGWEIRGSKGSKCYKISGRTQSGYYYSYWTPKGCP